MATIVSGPAYLMEPSGIAIDYVTQRIYWADSGGRAIGVVGHDGSGPTSLVSALPTSPFQVAVDGDFIFWSSFESINYSFVDRMDPGRVYGSQLLEPLARSFTLFGMVVVNSNRRPNPGTYVHAMLFMTKPLHNNFLMLPLYHWHAGYQVCLNGTTSCSHFCNATGGIPSCFCPQGFTLAEDGRRCGKSRLCGSVSD